MNAYEKVFREFVQHLSPERADSESRIFYTDAVHRIMSWTDMTDREQIREIQKLDHAFRTIVECSNITGK